MVKDENYIEATNEDKKMVKTFCPSCHEETLEVTIENSGKGYNDYWGQYEYWFDGVGKCQCGFNGHYGDSSL